MQTNTSKYAKPCTENVGYFIENVVRGVFTPSVLDKVNE